MFNQESRAAVTLQVLRLPNVLNMTGLCRSAIYQLESENKFPKRIQLGPRTVGWLEHEIQDWISQRITAQRNTGSH